MWHLWKEIYTCQVSEASYGFTYGWTPIQVWYMWERICMGLGSEEPCDKTLEGQYILIWLQVGRDAEMPLQVKFNWDLDVFIHNSYASLKQPYSLSRAVILSEIQCIFRQDLHILIKEMVFVVPSSCTKWSDCMSQNLQVELVVRSWKSIQSLSVLHIKRFLFIKSSV